jgi:hypothetical protein
MITTVVVFVLLGAYGFACYSIGKVQGAKELLSKLTQGPL